MRMTLKVLIEAFCNIRVCPRSFASSDLTCFNLLNLICSVNLTLFYFKKYKHGVFFFRKCAKWILCKLQRCSVNMDILFNLYTNLIVTLYSNSGLKRTTFKATSKQSAALRKLEFHIQLLPPREPPLFVSQRSIFLSL